PVMLPPGRLMLATRPTRTGSAPMTNTIGVVAVAALPACAAGTPAPTIAATCLRRPAILDGDVFAFDESSVIEALPKGIDSICEAGSRGASEKSDYRHRRLLRARRERPRCSAANKHNELAPLHSITSSARASSVGGISRPSALAVFWLVTSS